MLRILEEVRVIVSGAPVTAEFAAQIGAGGYVRYAGSAVEVAKQALGQPIGG